MYSKEEKPQEDQTLTLKEACALLGCHPNTLRQWDKNGLLHAMRVGTRRDRRYLKEDVLKLLGKSSYVRSSQEVGGVSRVRKDYVKDYVNLLIQWGNLRADSVFVDVPSGSGEMAKEFFDRGFGKSCYFIDINPEMIKASREHIADRGVFIVGDAGDIGKLVPEKVDAIFCLNGFHIYIDRKQDFLKGCYEILKPGGVLIFDVSTRGMHDALSREYLVAERKELEYLAKKAGAQFYFPQWPDEELLEEYRGLAMQEGFQVNEEIFINTWKPLDEVIHETLSIPGRLRPWLLGVSDEKRIEIYREATSLAKEKTGIEIIQHNRLFLVAKK